MSTLVPPIRAEVIPPEPPPLPRPRWWWRCLMAIGSGCEWLFGLLSLILGLSMLATVPVVQLLSLGYLLETSGRIARCGRLRDGFIGVRKAARVGSVVLGTWLALWPVRAVSGLWYSSLLIHGNTGPTRWWRVALVLLTALTIAHLAWAWFRGGRIRHFLWPAPVRLVRRLAAGGWYAEGRDRFWRFLIALRFPYYFRLGLVGALGAMAWLLLPVTLLMLASRIPVPLGVVAGLLGALLLAVVLVYLPFLQVRYAALGHWRQLFQVRAVRDSFRRAPIAYWIALAATLALAVPLYLLKAELVPREAAWLPSLVFVVFILPARWSAGWAVARSNRREQPRHFIFRWMARLSMLPITMVYVLIVYFTQYVSWYGGLSLYEQHAFLLPVPFLGM